MMAIPINKPISHMIVVVSFLCLGSKCLFVVGLVVEVGEEDDVGDHVEDQGDTVAERKPTVYVHDVARV